MTTVKLLIVRFIIGFLNSILAILEKLFFWPRVDNPRKIIIYKIGNIGDMVCAMPALLTIRKNFPGAHITLLSSPGSRGAPGAKELLGGSNLFDEMKIYFSEDIAGKEKRKIFIDELKKNNYDLFIQLPEDLASFRTLFRNIMFAKLLGVKSAIGFRLNTLKIFKKTQIDNLVAPQETERLLNILNIYGIYLKKIDFLFNINEESKKHVHNLLSQAFENDKLIPLIAVNPGGKRATSCWPTDRYRDLAEYLNKKYRANIAVLGGPHEKEMGDKVVSRVPAGERFNACGVLSLIETAELLRHSAILITNSTGTIHIGAAAGVRCVGFYSIRDIPGKWSPFGHGHTVLCHLGLTCDYNSEDCIRKSVELITLKEAIKACDDILQPLKTTSDNSAQ